MTMEPPAEFIGARDRAVIAGEIGRTPRDVTGIAARCPYGYPAVIETAPILTEGAPNPTLLYLTCPALAMIVSRVESSGGVKRFRQLVREDDALREVLMTVTRLYQERRAALAARETAALPPGERLGAGIGGPESPEVASCLHAYAAAILAVLSGWLVGQKTTSRPATDTAGLAARANDAWLRFLPALDRSWCNDRRCSRWDIGKRPAAIDVGTISVRLLVAEMAAHRPRPVVRRAEVTHLGEDLQPGACFTEVAKKRTAEAVARYVEEARRLGADTIILAATSAARIAADGVDFVEMLGRENDINAVVLSGTQEARLSFAGARLDVKGDAVVLDIGGGSTEITRQLESGAVQTVSLEIGASRATSRWLNSDPPTEAELAGARREAAEVFSRFSSEFRHGTLDEPPDPVVGERSLVGVAGTITTLACLDAGLKTYDPRFLHLRTLTLEAVRSLVRRLSSMTTAERAVLPCMQPGRASLIVGGAVVLQAAMETLGYDRLTVSETDLLDGLVMHGVG
jgi:exopolyphosphatase/guanosine-5'-triphosphate,3'-diphosphate pyrophosphatase